MAQQTVERTSTAQDFLRQAGKSIQPIFAPKTVAVIGSTEKPGSVGRTITWNLISSPFGGTVFPVNPKRPSVLGVKAYPAIKAVPERVDLAVIVTPSSIVPGVVQECVEAGVRGAIVISAGFRELGPAGVELEQQVLQNARRRIRLIGPNCLGVMNPILGLNATFASTVARPGNVAFISQSGALCTAILDWSLRQKVGFSAFVSIGSMLDVGWGDLIDFLGDDPRTESILIYMESIGDARSFLSAAREVALNKPIIVIKAGRTEQAAQAAVSHTGSLAGRDDVLDAAFRRCGVLRVNSIAHLFYMADVLGKQPRPRGRRLTIITNAGGPAVLATDALITAGGQLAEQTPETLEALNGVLPPHWSRGNPIDILGDSGPDRYAQTLEIASRDPNTDGFLVVLTPQDMTDPTRTAEQLADYASIAGKPVLASWMGTAEVAAGVETLNHANIPTFPYPDTAAKAFNYMWRYSDNLAGLYETPAFTEADPDFRAPARDRAEEVIARARQSGRTILTEIESKRLLEAYGIPTVPTELAESEDDAVRLADAMGYPVALKVHSETITHKTDVGGVALGLSDGDAVRRAFRDISHSVTSHSGAEHFQGVTVQPMVQLEGYELILGSSLDPQFGPVLLFGAGGQLVEVFKDSALALPPLNTTLARRLMKQTRIYTALNGVRGRRPVPLSFLEQLLVRFSQLVTEQQWIKETDINPLVASADGVVALDARVVLHGAEMTEERLPQPAIRPYPIQYVTPAELKDGGRITIRPIRPEDEPLLIRFHESLSERSVQLRYLHHMKLQQRIEHDRLIRVCFIDYHREMALVAEGKNPESGARELLGVGRLSRHRRGRNDAEFAVVVGDQWQGRGLGTELLRRLVCVAREEGVESLVGYIHPENFEMRRICEKQCFEIHHVPEEELLRALRVLQDGLA